MGPCEIKAQKISFNNIYVIQNFQGMPSLKDVNRYKISSREETKAKILFADKNQSSIPSLGRTLSRFLGKCGHNMPTGGSRRLEIGFKDLD